MVNGKGQRQNAQKYADKNTADRRKIHVEPDKENKDSIFPLRLICATILYHSYSSEI